VAKYESVKVEREVDFHFTFLLRTELNELGGQRQHQGRYCKENGLWLGDLGGHAFLCSYRGERFSLVKLHGDLDPHSYR
jgi:hypothetical protein